ncbi:hypothetical protein FACS1894111_02830 [Clostridia bacterium]|nr:hypothetical protein FACS1894111_02830 [Clostridia bacterium]
MRKICIFLLLLLCLGTVASCGEKKENGADTGDGSGKNLIINGDFENGTKPWLFYPQEGGKGAFSVNGDKQAVVSVKDMGRVEYSLQLNYSSVVLKKGCTYRLSFDAKSSSERQIAVRFQLGVTPYTPYGEERFILNPAMQNFSYTFDMEWKTDMAARLVLNFGVPMTLFPGEQQQEIILDNFRLELVKESGGSLWGYEMPPIHVDQLGYGINAAKTAIIAQGDADFQICRTDDDAVVYSGTAGDLMESRNAGESVRIANFSKFKKEGNYYIKNSEGRSLSFAISNRPYEGLKEAVFDMFKYQQCGEAITNSFWEHEACHTSLARIYETDTRVDVSGGWHDGGNYGRYVPPATTAVANLLLAEKLAVDPNRAVLVEVRKELEWLLKMQDPESGGVYHQVTTAYWAGDTMRPEDDTEELILSPISSAATADFAAVMAMAYRSYEEGAPAFADQMLLASKRAWEWLALHPEDTGFSNPLGIVSSEYGDSENKGDGDERYWAACALFAATGADEYHNYVKQSSIYKGLGWEEVGDFGNISYLLAKDTQTLDGEREKEVKVHILEECQDIMKIYEEEPYQVALGEFLWESNATASENAMLLLLGNTLELDENYVTAAEDQLHYLLGRNPLSQCYLTGVGENPVKNPHHRLSEAVGLAVPGMLAAGPNKALDDNVARSLLTKQPPAKCYIDQAGTFTVNEVEICWNAPLYFVVRTLEGQK